MKSSKASVYAHHGSVTQPLIWLERKWLDKVRLAPNQKVTVAIGSRRTTATVHVHNRARTVGLPAAFMQHCGVADGQKLHMQYNPTERLLRLGPIIGILVQYAGRTSGGRLFGEMTPFCAELAAAAKREGAILLVLTPQSIRAGRSSVSGWTYRRRWTRIASPMPDVLYNRLQTRKLEKTRNIQQMLKYVKNHFNTSIFNEQFLDKFSVFSALAKEPALRPLLPQSVPCKTMLPLRRMLAEHPVVFLKPATGSMGRGIVRIARHADGSFSTQTTHATGTSRQHVADFSKLSTLLGSRLRRQPHLLQQGLTLLAVGSHNLDFRALVQKDRHGKWDVTSIVARVAGSRHFVSNLARGGRLMSVMEALLKARVGRAKAKLIAADLRRQAIRVAIGLERQMSGHFGELGVDLAVDRDRRIWLLEVNSKPSKTDPLPPGESKVRPSARKAIQYAFHLAKF